MPLADYFGEDNRRVFVDVRQHGTTHLWDGMQIMAVVDNETALKRKNNNVMDISWDNDSIEIHVFFGDTPYEGHNPPKLKPVPQQQVEFDRRLYTINQVSNDAGMYQITLTTKRGRTMV